MKTTNTPDMRGRRQPVAAAVRVAKVLGLISLWVLVACLATLLAGCDSPRPTAGGTGGAKNGLGEAAAKVVAWANPDPLNHKHFVVLDSSQSSGDANAKPEVLKDEAIDAATLGGMYVHAQMLSWHQRAFTLSSEAINDATLETTIRNAAAQPDAHTPLSVALRSLLYKVKAESALERGRTFSASLATRGTDGSDEDRDFKEARRLSRELSRYPIILFIHGVHGERGAIDILTAATAPLGAKRIVAGENDFEAAEATFFARVHDERKAK